MDGGAAQPDSASQYDEQVDAGEEEMRGAISSSSCVSRYIAGSATIKSLEDPAPPEDHNCANSPVSVMLEFTADDPSQLPKATPYFDAITVSGGANPPKSCLAENSIALGATFPAVLRIIESGGCSPYAVTVELASLGACTEQCW